MRSSYYPLGTSVLAFFLLIALMPAYSQLSSLDNPLKNESWPTLSPDGKEIYFISSDGTSTRIMYSTKKNDAWSPPVPLEEINSYIPKEAEIKGLFRSYTGQRIYFATQLDDSKGGYDIYFTPKEDGKWQKPINIGPPVNTIANEYAPSVSGDGRFVYFTRSETTPSQDDFSCEKIYVSELSGNGQWQKPSPMTIPINSGCESSPLILIDNKSLVYASVREENTGGWDLYFTKMLAKDVWTTPKLIPGANSDYRELHPSISYPGNILFYASQEDSRKGLTSKLKVSSLPIDMQAEKTFHLQGKILDLKTNAPLQANVQVIEPATSRIVSQSNSSPDDGSYEFYLTPGKEYKLEIYKEGYSHSYHFLPPGETKKSVSRKDFRLFSHIDLILNVYDQEIFMPLNADIEVKPLKGTEDVQTIVKPYGNGRFMLTLPIGGLYQLIIDQAHYEKDTMVFDVTGMVQFDEFERDIELAPLKKEFVINVADEETNEAMDVEIVITNLENNEQIVTKPSRNKDGKYVIKLREGDKYEVNVRSPKGYAFFNTTVDMKSKVQEQKLDVKLKPLKAKTKIELQNINFETNSAELDVSSYAELDRVVQLMNDNPEIKIEISAHTDDVGSKRYNNKLSDKRAESVVNYLKEKEIPEDRLISKGYGEDEPLVPNTSEENRAKNRRVELKIVDISTGNKSEN
jgi:outer membrane protein OmpA-like peptidoglycan-associated protein